jgi:predicted alpha/beta superfamily hydrolase
MRKQVSFITGLFLLNLSLPAQDDKILEIIKNWNVPDRVSSITNHFELASKETNTIYKIHIHLPLTYFDGNKKYPVFYVTDGFYTSGLASATFDMLSMPKQVSEVIIVAIDYDSYDMVDYSRNRFRDHMPTHVTGYEPSGGADKFLAFFENELFPFVEKNFRADSSERCYSGHSSGALFGAYVLLEKPQLFNKYMLGSPAYWWDNNDIINKAKKSSDKLKGQHLIIYTYEYENKNQLMNFNEFNNILKSSLGQNSVIDKVYKNETHHSVAITAFSEAVRVLYGIKSK